MRAGMIEVEVREEVTREMEERMQVMERMFSRRLASEVRRLSYTSFPLLFSDHDLH
jgi:hypothetical protein